MKKTPRARKAQNPARKSSRARRIFLYSVLLAGIWGALISLLCLGGAVYGRQLQEGDIALQTLYAPFNFFAKGELDEAKTDQLRQTAAREIQPVFDVDLEEARSQFEKIDQLISAVTEMKQIQEATIKEKQDLFLEKLKPLQLTLSEENMEFLIEEADLPGWGEKLKKALETLLKLGILPAADEETLGESEIHAVSIRDPEQREETDRDLAEVLTLEQAKSKVETIVLEHFPESRKNRAAGAEVLQQLVVPSLVYQAEETERRKKLAAESVLPVHRLIRVKKNELIVSRGQKVSQNHLKLLAAIEKQTSQTSPLANNLGNALLVTLLIAIFILYFRRYDPKILREISSLFLLGAVAVVTIGLGKAVTLSPLSSFLIPIPLASMLTTILLNPAAGIMVTILLSLLATTTVAQKFGLILVMVLSGLTAVYSVSRIRRRSEILKAGIWSGIAAAIGVVIISLISGLQIQVSVNEGIWGLVNGIVSAIIVIGTLPAFEALFKVTTNISLLELSDLNHPILRELFIHAQGTYHHSLVVGNLAESACEAIGANDLLARVGAYYHDIGKMEKAEYFTENQMDSSSKQRHEKLSPTMSSLIIVNHIKNGIELAQRYNLPKRIIDFIPEHQGTSLIYFFYQKALQQAEEGEAVKEENFRYPGPKPQSKETAVVLLADSVEAASRSLEDPAPARIRGLVRKMINNKFIDGQLDECNLTLRDLNNISESFVKVLTGTFHTRVPYPEPKQTNGHNDKDKKSAENGQSRAKWG